MANPYFIIPRTGELIYNGDKVILSEFPDNVAIASYGWYIFHDVDKFGWYFLIIEDDQIVPKEDVDLDLINKYPKPCPDPPVDDRAFITVETVEDRDSMDTDYMPDGRIVRVDSFVNGTPRYFQWDKLEQHWIDWDIQIDIDSKQHKSVYSDICRPPMLADKGDYFESGDVWTCRLESTLRAYILIESPSQSDELWAYSWKPSTAIYQQGTHPSEADFVERTNYQPQGINAPTIAYGIDCSQYHEGDFVTDMYSGTEIVPGTFSYLINCSYSLEEKKFHYKWVDLATLMSTYTKSEVNALISGKMNSFTIGTEAPKDFLQTYQEFLDLYGKSKFYLDVNGVLFYYDSSQQTSHSFYKCHIWWRQLTPSDLVTHDLPPDSASVYPYSTRSREREHYYPGFLWWHVPNNLAVDISNADCVYRCQSVNRTLTSGTSILYEYSWMKFPTGNNIYTKSEVNNLISSISTLSFQIVQSLPTHDIHTNIIYLVPNGESGTQNVYDEWIYVNNSWELIGTTDIDLSSYMNLAPLNPTAQEIATLSNGQLYGDTVNHKGIIKDGQEFYDTNYIDNNYYTKTEIEQKGYLTLGSLPIYDGTVIEEKDVNFYDYDGTVLYSYTVQEALALAELPEAPTHEGLTFQGWNRTLAQLQAYVTDYGIGDAGATYITDDGATRLYLKVGQDVSLDYELYVQIANGTLSVEVDGVELGSATGTSSSYVNHTIPFTLPKRGNVRVDLKFTGTGGFYIGQGDLRTRVFGWNSAQNGSLVKVELGEHITSIDRNAFNSCTSLNSIVIPDSITGIGYYAFQNCASLNSVVIPNSIMIILSSVFQNCTSLNSIVIPNSVTIILDSVFPYCTSLNSIVIPNSVTHIDTYAFQNCTSLNSIVIPDSITSIGYYAFLNCTSLNSIVIPNSITSIGESAFYGCSLLLFFDLSQYTDPNNLPTFTNSNFLSNTPANQIIYVANQEMLTAFSSAPNISVYANRMVVKEATP